MVCGHTYHWMCLETYAATAMLPKHLLPCPTCKTTAAASQDLQSLHAGGSGASGSGLSLAERVESWMSDTVIDADAGSASDLFGDTPIAVDDGIPAAQPDAVELPPPWEVEAAAPSCGEGQGQGEAQSQGQGFSGE